MTLRKFVKLVILEDYECAHYATGYQWLDLMLFYTLIILIMTFEQKINIIKMGLQVRVEREREREKFIKIQLHWYSPFWGIDITAFN